MTEETQLRRHRSVIGYPDWFEQARLAVRAVAERERREQLHARQPVKPFKHGPLPEPKHKSASASR